MLVSERGLEPPRGVKPHQVLSLAGATFPLGTEASQCHSSHLGASQCNKVEILVLGQGALRVPRQENLRTRSCGIRSASALGLKPRGPTPLGRLSGLVRFSLQLRLRTLGRLADDAGCH